MSTIADLLIKIGADSSGLNSELNKAKGQIDKTFSTNPIDGFKNALEGTSSTLSSFASKFAAFSAAAGAGFGFASLISGAAKAGEATHDLSERLGITNAEAAQFSRTVQLAGGDINTAASSIMRLDKTISSTGDSSDRARGMLNAVGVSLTDANGKLLPLNDQLAALAQGYKVASAAGYQQEFLLETLGSKGAALAGVLNEYTQAAQNASAVQSVGLDIDQADKVAKQLDLLQMQAKALGITTGAVLIPIVQEFLPPLTSGLADVAKVISDNKAEVVDLTKSVVTFIAIYKTFQALKAAGDSISAFGSTAGSSASVAATEALTKAEETAINRRIKLVENAALAEERAYYKTLQTADLTEAEKTRQFAAYCAKRQAAAAQEAAVLRTEMTKAYLQINAASAESTVAQTANLGKVGVASAVTGAKVAGIGTSATVAGTKMVAMASGSIGVISKLTSAVWALAGGWMGVAAAIGYTAVKFYDFLKSERQKAANDPVYEYNDKKYQYDADDNVMVRLKDNGTRMNIYDQDEMNGAYAAAREQGLKLPGEEEKDQQNSAMDEYNKAIEDSKAQIEEFMKSLQVGTDANGDLTKASKQAAGKVEKLQNVEVPLGEIAAQNALNAYDSAPGSQWLNPELTSDLNNSCAAFVASMYKAAGVADLYTASGTQIDAAFKNVGAWHSAGSGYVPQAGDYVSSPEHVGMYVGNDQIISRDSRGGLRTRSLADWQNTFGIIGYGSIGEYTGGRTTTMSMNDSDAAQEAALKKLRDAKNQAVQLFTSMQNEIAQTTGTTWTQGMDQIAQNVQAKQQEINKLQAAGVSDDAIQNLESKLAEYRTALTDKVEKQRTQALARLVSETKQATAEASGDYKAMADAEYEATITSLDKEREEREKEVAKNKDDKEAMAAVEEWYTAKVAEAAEKRTESYRDAFKQQLDFVMQANNAKGMMSMLNSPEAQAYMDWAGQSKAMQAYYDLWQEANVTTEEQVAEVAEKAQSSLADFFQNLFTGNETLLDSLGTLVDSIMESILEQITNKWSAQIMQSIFGGMFGGDQNNNNGGDIIGGGLANAASGLISSTIGGLFGGGSDSSSGSGSGDAVSGLFSSISKWTTGINSANAATSILTGSTSGLNKATGLYNNIQTLITATTKPAEQTADITATVAMTKLAFAATSASIALKSISLGTGLATGGYISGPGTSTSDSIPTMLSNGEFVINAAAVDRVGAPLLQAINNGKRISHFSSGGIVSGGSSNNGGLIMQMGSNIVMNVSAVDAESFTDFLQRYGGKAIKQFLLDTDRDYTGSSDVW